MRVSKQKLRELISEEYLKLLSEINLCHSSETGYFKKCNPGSVYSLTKKGASDNNVDSKFVGRGVVSSKDEDKPPKLRSKFGQNQIGGKKVSGRKEMTGRDISPKYSVSKYPERYKEELDKLKSFPDLKFGVEDIEQAMLMLEEDTDINDECRKCERCRGVFYKSFLNALNNAQRAMKGDLNAKK